MTVITDREAAELEAAKAKQAAPVPLPVGEQIAILTVATVISAAVLFILGTNPTFNGLLVGAVIILAVIIVSKDEPQ